MQLNEFRHMAQVISKEYVIVVNYIFIKYYKIPLTSLQLVQICKCMISKKDQQKCYYKTETEICCSSLIHCLIYCLLSSAFSITLKNLVSLGLPALFRSALSTQWVEEVLPKQNYVLCCKEKRMGKPIVYDWCWNFQISSRCGDICGVDEKSS